MSSSAIFIIGVVAVVLLAIFTYETIHGISHARVDGDAGARRSSEPDIEAASMRPLKILIATDGSPCSDRAVQSVAMRPWPAGTQLELISVIHTNVPFVPEPTLTGIAGYEQALEAERRDAPVRVERAERFLNGHSALPVATKVLEGEPGHAIVQEADRWQADLLVVGSHGYSPVKRALLGSVSRHVSNHAPCSVEIVRCPHEGP
jgi:nucleotide-binding universal stress UspA family protein